MFTESIWRVSLTALKLDPGSVRRDVVKLEQAGMLRTCEETIPGHGRVRIVEPVAGRVEIRALLQRMDSRKSGQANANSYGSTQASAGTLA